MVQHASGRRKPYRRTGHFKLRVSPVLEPFHGVANLVWRRSEKIGPDRDNQERVCVDVYGYAVGQIGSGGGGAPGGGTSKAQALLRELKANFASIMQKKCK